MARDLKLNVDGNSGGAQRALDEVAAAADLAAREADKLGKQFKQAERDASSLDRQLLETAVAARALARELAKNPADKSIKAQLAAQKKASGELKNLRRDIIGDTEKAAKDAERVATQAAKEFEKLGKTVEQTGSSIGDVFGGGGVGGFLTSGPGAVIGAPLAIGAGAAAGGATAALTGAGVAGIGIAGAALGDPAAFSAAWASATAKIKAQFIDATRVFDGPGLDAVNSIGDAIGRWDLKGLFAAAVGYVKPLVSGAEAAAGYIFDGVKALTQDAGPAVAVLAADLPEIGRSLGSALEAIGSQSEGGAQGLHSLLVAVEETTLAIGYFVTGTEAIVGGLANATHAGQDFFANIPLWVKIALPNLALIQQGLNFAPGRDDGANASRLAQSLAGLASNGNLAAAAAARHADALAKLDAQMGLTTVKATSLSQGVDQIFQAMLAADHAALSWDESLTGLGDAIKTNGKTLDQHTAKGQANREAILGSIAANAQLYVSNIEQGKGVDFATNAYDKNEKALEATARQAGLSQAQIDQLVGKYRSVPDTVKTDIKMQGLTDAINGLDDVLRRINHLPPRRTINIDVVVGGQLGLAQSLIGAGLVGGAAPKHKAMGGIRHAAAGMIVPPSNPGTLVVGEPQTGGEAFIPLGNSITDSGAMSLAGVVGAAHGFAVGPRVPSGLFGGRGGSDGAVAVTIHFGGAVDTAMGAAFMKLLRTGDVQIRANQVLP